ncbi:hypothetical protein B0H10DRAFT_2218082 [Mycena sp. CBHHK59/15]|nr:hypothetical protein B0H10DRAFT_2218082 [Mycena sp. CBHHK59/15]
MSAKSASRKLSGPGAVFSFKPTSHGQSSDSFLKHHMKRPANFGPLAFLLSFLVLSVLVSPCHAQTSKIFQWQFSGNALSSSLPSCRSFGITVKPFDPANNTHGVPPFYMMAMAVNGTPSMSLIGTDESNLSWTVNQPVGTELLLYVVDSQGSSGGVPPNTFTVTAGQTTQCIPAPSTDPPFTVTANVTGTINTCQPWGLTIKGGAPPYNLTLAALNSPIITNVTMGPNDDAFTFIDRADPNTQLIAAISDLNGRWASGVPIVKTAGSSNVNCTGLVSSSGNSTQIKQAEQAALATSSAHKKTAIITGVVVTLVVLLILGGAAVFLFIRRRKMQQKAREFTPRQFEAGDPQPFEETGGQVLSINAFISPSSPTTPRSPKSPKSPTNASTFSNSMSPSNTVAGTPAPFDRRRFAGTTDSHDSHASAGLSVRNPSRPAVFSSFPAASVRRSAKEIEAGLHTGNSLHSDYSAGGASDASSRHPLVERSQSAMAAGPSQGPRFPARAASLNNASSSLPGEEIIFQHQDAGVVRELPPPYADRGR